MKQCRAHHKPQPCVSCASAAQAQRQIWTTSHRRKRHAEIMAEREETWFDEELSILRQMAGFYAAEDITVAINQRRAVYGLKPRSTKSIMTGAKRYDVSLFMSQQVYSLSTLATVLGVSPNSIRAWQAENWLPARRWGKFVVFDEATLITFLREYPWLLDAEGIQPGPLRQVALSVNQRDPWLRSRDVAKLSHICMDTMLKYIRLGWVEAHQRTGHHAAYMLRASSVLRVSELLRTSKQHYSRELDSAA